MGCGASKPKGQGRTLGGAPASSASRAPPTAPANTTGKTAPRAPQNNFAGNGRSLGGIGAEEEEDPRQKAALAAEARLQNSKSQQGKLGKKLIQDRAKTRNTVLNETSAENATARDEPLIYD